ASFCAERIAFSRLVSCAATKTCRSYGKALNRILCPSGQERGGGTQATPSTASATAPPSVGSANPSAACIFEISCTAGHSRSMPSAAQSTTNLATAVGAAGQAESPLSSHHLANIGAARIRACANAASSGFVEINDA